MDYLDEKMMIVKVIDNDGNSIVDIFSFYNVFDMEIMFFICICFDRFILGKNIIFLLFCLIQLKLVGIFELVFKDLEDYVEVIFLYFNDE